MYQINPERRIELSRKLEEVLCEPEKELLHKACMYTADELSAMNKRVQNLVKPSNDLTAAAGLLYELALILEYSMQN